MGDRRLPEPRRLPTRLGRRLEQFALSFAREVRIPLVKMLFATRQNLQTDSKDALIPATHLVGLNRWIDLKRHRAAALLLYRGDFQTVESALQFIQSKRPLVRLGSLQFKTLSAAQQQGENVHSGDEVNV